MSIEDAIKRCKEIISKCDDCKFATCEQCEINWTDIQAIKIVLGNLEALADMQKTADRELENAKKINEEHKKENGELREKVKELEEELYSANKIVEEYLDGIPKQKVKDIAKQIQEEYDKVQEQFDCIWDKKSKDNYDRYKLQELSAVQQELGFILGKFEELLEEGD